MITYSFEKLVAPKGKAAESGRLVASLGQSMMLLDDSLISGAIIGEFEQLYRR